MADFLADHVNPIKVGSEFNLGSALNRNTGQNICAHPNVSIRRFITAGSLPGRVVPVLLAILI